MQYHEIVCDTTRDANALDAERSVLLACREPDHEHHQLVRASVRFTHLVYL